MTTTQRATPATGSPSANTKTNPSIAPPRQKARQSPSPAKPSAASQAQCLSATFTAQTQNAQHSTPAPSMQQHQINQLKETLNQTAPMIQQLHHQGLISTATHNAIKDEFELSRITLSEWSQPAGV